MYIKKNTLIRIIAISIIALFAVVFVVAQSITGNGQPVPNYLNYQGRLIDQSTGQPIPDGNHNVTFRIYDAESGGSLKDGPYSSNVTTQNGLFNTLIGQVEPSVFDSSDLWVEMEVDGETISPRQRIVSVAYAIRATSAADADTLEGHPASDFSPTEHSHSASDITSGTLSEDRLPQNAIDSSEIEDGSITNTDISNTANISPNKINGTAWTSDNDGSGSGLDADKLDGKDSSAFLSTSTDYGRSGVASNLYEGTTKLSDKYLQSPVGTADIANNAITSAKIQDGQVTSTDIANNTITEADIADSFKARDADKLDGLDSSAFGDITAVNAGDGLTDGGQSGDVTLNVGGGTGISVSNDEVALNTTYTDGRYVNEGQANSVTSSMIVDGEIQASDLDFTPVTNPLDGNFTVNNGSVLFSGTTGATPASGAGTRMMWIPEKEAFRAGAVSWNQWDADNIGDFSFAVGYDTKASGSVSTAMGYEAEASGYYATAMGFSAKASGTGSTAMGTGAVASGQASTAMGQDTTASGNFATAMGLRTTASGSWSTAMGTESEASGVGSTAMGASTASGDYSTSMGTHASTNGHNGSFVYGDNSPAAVMNATTDNQFMVRASGGTIFYSNSNLTAGVSLAPGGGSWSSVSDRNKKENFKEEDGEEVLRKISGMPISSWNYKSQHPSIRHLGPTAQDFYAAFGLGESDTKITTTDIDGINMLAIQALEKRTTELKAKIEELEKVRSELAEVKAENAEMKRKMAQFEAALQRLEALTATSDNFDGSGTSKNTNN